MAEGTVAPGRTLSSRKALAARRVRARERETATRDASSTSDCKHCTRPRVVKAESRRQRVLRNNISPHAHKYLLQMIVDVFEHPRWEGVSEEVEGCRGAHQ